MKNPIKKLRSIYRNLTHDKSASLLFQQRANLLNESVLNSTKIGITDSKYCDDHQIIVSLTTYGVRLSQVYLSIESIMQQTKRANRIVLWLAKDLEHTVLPQTLINQMSRGLEIYYCDDIRSYKKLIPSLKKFPNDAIITIDDDVIYHVLTLESLINSYLEDSNYIYSNRIHRVVLDKNGLKPYTAWDMMIACKDVSTLNFPTGVGGILYPPHVFNDEVFNEDVFMRECMLADDVWFYAMTLYNNKRSCRSKAMMVETDGGFLENTKAQQETLSSKNVAGGLNDKQLKAVFDRYDLYKELI